MHKIAACVECHTAMHITLPFTSHHKGRCSEVQRQVARPSRAPLSRPLSRVPLTQAELDVCCGVVSSHSGAPCRRAITCETPSIHPMTVTVPVTLPVTLPVTVPVTCGERVQASTIWSR